MWLLTNPTVGWRLEMALSANAQTSAVDLHGISASLHTSVRTNIVVFVVYSRRVAIVPPTKTTHALRGKLQLTIAAPGCRQKTPGL